VGLLKPEWLLPAVQDVIISDFYISISGNVEPDNRLL